jgi:rhodanese-related sulfurtransferase
VSEETARTTIDDLLREARSGLQRLPPEEALAAQGDGALLIDTRSNDERARDGVIPGSIHIPRTVLEWRVDPAADPEFHNPHVVGLDQHLILVCAHGESTSLAAATLQKLGFSRATDLVGGFAAWQAAGLPVRPAPDIDAGVVPGMGDPEASLARGPQ